MKQLMLAIQHGEVGFIDEYFATAARRATINTPNESGLLPIYLAAQNGHAKIVERLHSFGAQLDAKVHGVTPLCIAVQEGHIETAKVLLVAGCNPNLASTSGITPLRYAMRIFEPKKRQAMEALLIAHRADINQISAKGQTALYEASRWRHADSVRRLGDLGATGAVWQKKQAASMAPVARPLFRYSPSEMAKFRIRFAKRQRENELTFLQSYRDILQKKGAIFGECLPSAEVLLYKAAELGSDDDVNVLLAKVMLGNKDFDVNTQSAVAGGATLLYLAVQSGDAAKVAVLSRRYMANPNQPVATMDGETPLMLAAQKGDGRVVRELLKSKAGKSRAGIGLVSTAKRGTHDDALALAHGSGMYSEGLVKKKTNIIRRLGTWHKKCQLAILAVSEISSTGADLTVLRNKLWYQLCKSLGNIIGLIERTQTVSTEQSLAEVRTACDRQHDRHNELIEGARELLVPSS